MRTELEVAAGGQNLVSPCPTKKIHLDKFPLYMKESVSQSNQELLVGLADAAELT